MFQDDSRPTVRLCCYDVFHIDCLDIHCTTISKDLSCPVCQPPEKQHRNSIDGESSFQMPFITP
ncbi:hypothetical protein ROZALSC1DRAFT_27169 [Rozella allomycis CSF55]|uniref:Uncharacterized protein n=1 Tax=Rozella allomycis (strain CSF55) TaxID=988480 RepID=A0A075AVC2_ROZAC|nr:hypothetical protein O9G_002728 [Rozella allomycis CSF55]RKP21433.1 hypothetical protein ROZALSC1DRAFT_27169 [Rozella allomycis CSF55]|eukprot:EPZ32642.1 hypothetical protein O9G_002728 [Rozella allomycis CSF55]